MEQEQLTAPTPNDAPAMEAQNAYPASVGQAVGLLATGLAPGLGIVLCLWWAYAAGHDEKQTLAKAMLWLHGAGLCALLVGLCLWVLRLAGF